VGIAFIFTLDAGLLASSKYPEGPATGHLDTGFSWFPCVNKQMLRWFPTFQVATTCFSCSPPDLNLVVTNFMFCLHVKLPLPLGDNPIAVDKHYYYLVWGQGNLLQSEHGHLIGSVPFAYVAEQINWILPYLATF